MKPMLGIVCTAPLLYGRSVRHIGNCYFRNTRYSLCSITILISFFLQRRLDDDKGRTHELCQSAVKCMRGILACWLRQADKVHFNNSFDLSSGTRCKNVMVAQNFFVLCSV